jgi:hypothetical protein
VVVLAQNLKLQALEKATGIPACTATKNHTAYTVILLLSSQLVTAVLKRKQKITLEIF